MKAVILAGGRGTRIEEESASTPKPMIEIGGKPLLRHIMDIFILQGVNDFIICGGYKWSHIIGYFYAQNPKIVNNNKNGEVNFEFNAFSVNVINTGLDTQTGGRIKRLENKVVEPFFLTYGDGLANVNLSSLFNFHKEFGGLCTLTAAHPEGRFGRLRLLNDGLVSDFGEKVEADTDWINGGFMVVEPDIMDFIEGDETNFEKGVLPVLAKERRLYAKKHFGFWKSVDTLRDLNELKAIWEKAGLDRENIHGN